MVLKLRMGLCMWLTLRGCFRKPKSEGIWYITEFELVVTELLEAKESSMEVGNGRTETDGDEEKRG